VAGKRLAKTLEVGGGAVDAVAGWRVHVDGGQQTRVLVSSFRAPRLREGREELLLGV
jgi:hypothetical protein